MIFHRTALFSALLLAGSFAATAAPLSKLEYKSGKADLETRYQADKKACDVHAGNAKDICIEEAKGANKVGLAQLEANYEPTAKHSYAVRVAQAKANLAIAKEKCDDLSGNPKDVCRQQADTAYTTAMAEAKLSLKTRANNGEAAAAITDAKVTAMDKNANARQAATADILDAQYKTASEKCNAFAGDVKAQCMAEAKTRFGK